ncbi:hypothetical protein ARMSODRAFT_1008534 [Armillaria solidipes]|uniref:F-box domain-containing protein n=1 Tax=Armillaria solidipes TaxID=1076256 RepID=A0A2H3AYK3_9AGAR|nr:hypothetical protein ARMSODRAFT_1008534 [Armillaria solidipes]
MQWPLSQEVSDIVVDLAVEEAYSLDNFALMSRTMLNRTRRHRFHRVTILIPPSSDECKKLYDILLSSKDIRPFVKSLVLKGPSYLELPYMFTQASLGETSWDATKYAALGSLTELLPALEEFHIEHFSRTHLPNEFLSQLRKCASVKKISFHNIAFSSYSSFASIIRAFPSLEVLCLKLVSATVDSESGIDVQDDAMVPTIKTLNINLSEELVLRMCGEICERADAPVSVAQLHTLRIGCIKEISHWDRARCIVQKSVTTLRNLQLGYIQTDTSGLGILPLPSLKHLHIHLNDFEEDKDVDVLRWWIRCFKDATASSVCLEKITITLRAYSHIYHEYQASDLTAMLSMKEETRILKYWFNIKKPKEEVFQDDVWYELVIIFTGAKAKDPCDDDAEDPFKKRVDRLKEIIGGRMNRFKKGGGVLVFEPL